MASALFRFSATCWLRTLLDAAVPGQQAVAFVHSWETNPNLTALVLSTLRPARHLFEAQPAFEAAPVSRDAAGNVLIDGHDPLVHLECSDRNGSHSGGRGMSYVSLMSQWTSRLRAMRLVLAHEHATGTRFDLTLLTRLDVCPCQRAPLLFSSLALSPPKVMRVGLMRTMSGSHLSTVSSRHWLHYSDQHSRLYDSGRSDGTLILDRHFREAARVDDLLLVGTTSALHTLTSAVVNQLPNMTLSLWSCDSHGVLAYATLRLFPTALVDVRVAGFAEYLPMNRVLSRYQHQHCMRNESLREDPAACFAQECAWREVFGTHAGFIHYALPSMEDQSNHGVPWGLPEEVWASTHHHHQTLNETPYINQSKPTVRGLVTAAMRACALASAAAAAASNSSSAHEVAKAAESACASGWQFPAQWAIR